EGLIPLTRAECLSTEARDRLQSSGAKALFPNARAPEAALAGLYLYFSCWEAAHETAQDVGTPEGSYWHAIVHRQEPDDGNSGYWFRQVGRHAVFPRLAEAAAALGYGAASRWDPAAFIEFCSQARRQPGTAVERIALEVQRAEWQLLFDYCAAKQSGG